MSQHAASNSRRDNAVAGRGWAAGVGKDLRRGAGVRRLSARQPSTGPIPATAAANHGRHHPRDRGGYRQDHLAHNHSPACVAIPLLAFFLSSSRLVPPRPSGLTRSGTMDCGRPQWPRAQPRDRGKKKNMHNAQFPGFDQTKHSNSTGNKPSTSIPHRSIHRNNHGPGGYISAVAPQTSSCCSTINQSPTGSGSFSSGQLTGNGTVRRDLHPPRLRSLTVETRHPSHHHHRS